MNLYFHTDLETTSLDALTGHIRSIGWVVTDGSLNEVDHGHYEQAVPLSLWDAGTWEWATKNYSTPYLQQFMGWKLEGSATAAWDGILQRLLTPFYAAVEEMEAEGHKCWLIANHPDFDATMLRAASKFTGLPFPFRYNRVLDMASLMMAYEAGWEQGMHCGSAFPSYELELAKEPSAILNEYGFTKEAVQHTSLEDAKRQVEILKAVGLRLPL